MQVSAGMTGAEGELELVWKYEGMPRDTRR